mgnify:FL=1
METETLVVAHLKEGMLEKFMGFMQSDAGMAERSKVANVSKTIWTVAPDKKTVMFKIFVIDKEALKSFINGSNPVSGPVMNEVMESYSIYELNKVEM